jgi:phage-related protein
MMYISNETNRVCGTFAKRNTWFSDISETKSGYELDKVQRGLNPKDWKAMPNLGPGYKRFGSILAARGAWYTWPAGTMRSVTCGHTASIDAA